MKTIGGTEKWHSHRAVPEQGDKGRDLERKRMGHEQQIKRGGKRIGQASIRVIKSPADLESCFGVGLVKAARRNPGNVPAVFPAVFCRREV